MARAVYSFELIDTDYSVLIESFLEDNPGYLIIDSETNPLTLLKIDSDFLPDISNNESMDY